MSANGFTCSRGVLVGYRFSFFRLFFSSGVYGDGLGCRQFIRIRFRDVKVQEFPTTRRVLFSDLNTNRIRLAANILSVFTSRGERATWRKVEQGWRLALN